jgi:hypothetical protein
MKLRVDFFENEIYDNVEMRVNVPKGDAVIFTKPIPTGSQQLRLDLNGGYGGGTLHANPYPAPENIEQWSKSSRTSRLFVFEDDLEGHEYWSVAVKQRGINPAEHKKFFATLSPKPQDEPAQLLVRGHRGTIQEGAIDRYQFNPGAQIKVEAQLPWSSRLGGNPDFQTFVHVGIYKNGQLLELKSTRSDCRGYAEFQMYLREPFI